MAVRTMDCGECGQRVAVVAFHPYWVCVLVKNRVRIEDYPELVRVIAEEQSSGYHELVSEPQP